jgi:ribonucleotide reductase alpha subunit
LFNCFVMGNIEDDLGGIFSHLREAALTMQQGGGIGYDFSSLRPKGAPVKGVGADAFGCRCPSWMYGTRCAAPSCPSAPAAAP